MPDFVFCGCEFFPTPLFRGRQVPTTNGPAGRVNNLSQNLRRLTREDARGTDQAHPQGYEPPGGYSGQTW